MIVRINARMIGPGSTQTNSVLMTFDDVTEIVDERRYQQMLSAELVHRVKNNLQIVSAFVALEAERAPPACATGCEALQTRIDAIASLYSAVSTNGVSDPVQLDRYIARVAKTVEASVLGKKSEMELLVNAEPIEVSADRASLVGIITNELVTNAAKHAFRAGSGKVMVALWREGETIVLSVRDNGCGMDPFRITPGLGTQLISRFVDQLGGVLETESGASGTTRTVRIPVSISEARARKKGTCIPVARDVPTAGMTVNKATVARPDA